MMQARSMRRALAVAAMLAAANASAGDSAAGKVKAEACLGCHGAPGVSNAYPTYHVPKVSGQHADYIVAALKGYASGERGHKTMQAQAATLSDQDMADIAAFFAGGAH